MDAERKQVTLADIYAERPLTDSQIRRIVSLLRLTQRPVQRAESA